MPLNKTPGCDDLDGELLKQASPRCLDMMLKFINFIREQGILPTKFKLSDIIPVYKKLTGFDID